MTIDLKLADIDSAFRVSLPLEVRLAAPETGTVTGYGSTFGGPPDVYGDIVQRGAFQASLAAHRQAGTMPAMLWSHRPDMIVGRWVDAAEDGKGLLLTGQVNLETQLGREALAHLKAGDLTGLSIGFNVPKGGRTLNRDGTATLLKVDLWEVSLVAMPANGRARVTEVRGVESRREFEKALAGLGFARAAAAKLAAGGWPALESAPSDLNQLAGSIDAAAAELRSILKGR